MGAGRPSMLQDVMKGRRTEIEYLDGYVASRGRRSESHSRLRPHTDLLKRVERGELKSEADNIQLMSDFM